MELRFGQHAPERRLPATLPPPWVIEKINQRNRRKPLVDEQPTLEIDDRIPPGYMPSEREPTEKVERGVVILQL